MPPTGAKPVNFYTQTELTLDPDCEKMYCILDMWSLGQLSQTSTAGWRMAGDYTVGNLVRFDDEYSFVMTEWEDRTFEADKKKNASASNKKLQ